MDNEPIINQLLESFSQFVLAAHPSRTLGPHLPEPPTKGRTIVLGAGKAASAMAAELENAYHAPLEGLVITRYGHKCQTRTIKVIEAAHPVPDEAGLAAVNEVNKLAASAAPQDLVIVLLSGGGSALLSAPVEGVSFSAIQQLTDKLLKSGANIEEMNCVRKHLNRLLGGGLAATIPRTASLTLAISDVIGDDPATIASGPTVADPTSLEDAREILEHYRITLQPEIITALNNPLNETPKPGDHLFDRHEYRLIATPSRSFEEIEAFWVGKGVTPILYNLELGGETGAAAKTKVAKLKRIIKERAGSEPFVLLSGGETTIELKGTGTGGPNTQFILEALIALDGAPGVYALAGDTDGIDGSGNNAGAYITPLTLEKARKVGLDARDFLANNDSYSFFSALNQLVLTGPTFTNVNDYRVFLVMPENSAEENSAR